MFAATAITRSGTADAFVATLPSLSAPANSANGVVWCVVWCVVWGGVYNV